MEALLRLMLKFDHKTRGGPVTMQDGSTRYEYENLVDEIRERKIYFIWYRNLPQQALVSTSSLLWSK